MRPRNRQFREVFTLLLLDSCKPELSLSHFKAITDYLSQPLYSMQSSIFSAHYLIPQVFFPLLMCKHFTCTCLANIQNRMNISISQKDNQHNFKSTDGIKKKQWLDDCYELNGPFEIVFQSLKSRLTERRIKKRGMTA